MSPHGEHPLEQRQVTKPAKTILGRPDDVVDTKGVIWTLPKKESVTRREQAVSQHVQDVVEARIKTGADMDEYKKHLIMELEELSQWRHELVGNKQGTSANENRLNAKNVEEQLKVIALFDAREKVSAQLGSGADIPYLLARGKQISQELENKLEEADDRQAEAISAKELIPHQAYMQVLKDLQKNPESLSGLRESQRALLDARLKATGGLGGSHEVLAPKEILLKKSGAIGGSHEIITKMGEPTEESLEARRQRLLEKKWMILRQELQDTEKELAGLGFLQRMFGEKGRMLKTRLARVRADQERVYKQILPARQKKLGTEFEAMARATRKE
ncbi:hypothetical protein HZA87_04250 [Candidatus Uhrbacteria bacterium]|nr:hypothetical protein [Candidatus Uhrbacteria bacterium]